MLETTDFRDVKIWKTRAPCESWQLRTFRGIAHWELGSPISSDGAWWSSGSSVAVGPWVIPFTSVCFSLFIRCCWQNNCDSLLFNICLGTSLVVQRPRIQLTMQGHGVRSWSWKSTCCWGMRPVSRNYWRLSAPGPMRCNKTSHSAGKPRHCSEEQPRSLQLEETRKLLEQQKIQQSQKKKRNPQKTRA